MPDTKTAAAIGELDYVELTREVEGRCAGTKGTVVSADESADSYTVELADDEGRFVFASRMDLALLQRARASHETNGRP